MNPDFILFTDGSGYKDGYGGWACLVKTPDESKKMFRLGFIAGATVDRMELTAILEGLQMVFELLPSIQPVGDRGRVWKPSVQLFCDRENLVLSISKIYGRGNSPDLWARFAFYEGIMRISATHVARETDYPEFQTVDIHASTARLVVKEYVEANQLPPHLPFQSRA